jgi:hypothetical protein
MVNTASMFRPFGSVARLQKKGDHCTGGIASGVFHHGGRRLSAIIFVVDSDI